MSLVEIGALFWRGYVPNMATLTIGSTCTQIIINDSYILKNSTVCQLLLVIRPILWLVSNGYMVAELWQL